MNSARNGHLAIVFDIGGVLLDWNPRYLYRRLFGGDQEAAEHFLEEINFREWNAHQDAGRSFAEAVNELTARFPGYADLIQAYDIHWEESIGGPDWGTVALLQDLSRSGHPLYALSNWSAEKFPLVRHKYPFFDLFESIVLSGEVRLAKPDPRIFDAFLQRAGREAAECLYIDDSTENVKVARAKGFATIHFKSARQLAAELRQQGLMD
jgi:2-haloacid dehalogenase